MGFLSFLKPTPHTGALIDTRSLDEKSKDYVVREVFAAAAPVLWVEKGPVEWRSFPVQNQDSSSSCVAQTLKKILGVQHLVNYGSYVAFSATHIYQQRQNRPGEGMSGVDAFEIARKQGITLDELVPSNNLDETEIMRVPMLPHHFRVAEVFKVSGHVGIPSGDIETIASVIQTTGKAVMTWFYFTSKEWGQDVPVMSVALSGPDDPRSLRHSVAAVDYCLYKGKKALIIEDSAHFGGKNRRIITEDFFAARNWFNRYAMNFTFEVPEDDDQGPISHKFKQELVFIPLTPSGDISNPALHAKQEKDVVVLQNILKKEGCLPTNISSTGYYGSITAKAVLAFQSKHRVASEAELQALRGRVVGPKTIDKLNALYSSK